MQKSAVSILAIAAVVMSSTVFERTALAQNCIFDNPPTHTGRCAFLKFAYSVHEASKLQAWQVAAMIEAGADVNAEETSRTGKLYDTPLNIFSLYKNSEAVAVLLKHGANVNSRRWDGRTPLISALIASEVPANTYEIVLMLLNAGADVNVRDNDGNTPLLLAAETGEQDIVDLLKKHGGS